MPLYHYSAFGLAISSEMHCPELSPSSPERPADVEIRVGPVVHPTDAAETDGPQTQTVDGIYHLHVPQVARYRTSEGREIVVEPLPGAIPEDVRLFLLGTMFGALLHQRGELPLHASAVSVGGAAVAFCGHSGAGKSTLAAALHRRGFPLLSDDTGVVLPAADGSLVYHPGVPRIRLWRDALDHFDIDTAGLVRDISRADKFHLHPSAIARRGASRLVCVYFLESVAGDEPVRIDALSLPERIPRLMEQTYRSEIARDLGRTADQFRQCAGIARSIPLRVFSRPWSLDRLEGALDVLEADLRRIAA
jgi:hypothetical protein